MGLVDGILSYSMISFLPFHDENKQAKSNPIELTNYEYMFKSTYTYLQRQYPFIVVCIVPHPRVLISVSMCTRYH